MHCAPTKTVYDNLVKNYGWSPSNKKKAHSPAVAQNDGTQLPKARPPPNGIPANMVPGWQMMCKLGLSCPEKAKCGKAHLPIEAAIKKVEAYNKLMDMNCAGSNIWSGGESWLGYGPSWASNNGW